MKHFINIKDVPYKTLRKILSDTKKRKDLRKKLKTLEIDKDNPLKGIPGNEGTHSPKGTRRCLSITLEKLLLPFSKNIKVQTRFNMHT